MAGFGLTTFQIESRKTVILRHCQQSDVDSFLHFQSRKAAQPINTFQSVGSITDREATVSTGNSSFEDEVTLRLGAFLNNEIKKLRPRNSPYISLVDFS